ncbi:MAG: hypothetical protein BV458_03250 [Thermoplasmata archaeon M9B2D]|nr:MAG: hypothetical protein BV458_03250 [Thermoplasmata archaeon M9B2D]
MFFLLMMPWVVEYGIGVLIFFSLVFCVQRNGNNGTKSFWLGIVRWSQKHDNENNKKKGKRVNRGLSNAALWSE